MIKEFLAKIDAFLARHDKSDTWFGERMMGDKSFVHQVRRGVRSPSVRTIEKVQREMAKYENKVAAESLPDAS